MSTAQTIGTGIALSLGLLVLVGAVLTRVVYVALARIERERQGAVAGEGNANRPTTVRGASRLFSAVWSRQVLADVDARTTSAIWTLRAIHVLYFVLFFATLATFLAGVVRAA